MSLSRSRRAEHSILSGSSSPTIRDSCQILNKREYLIHSYYKVSLSTSRNSTVWNYRGLEVSSDFVTNLLCDETLSKSFHLSCSWFPTGSSAGGWTGRLQWIAKLNFKVRHVGVFPSGMVALNIHTGCG